MDTANKKNIQVSAQATSKTRFRSKISTVAEKIYAEGLNIGSRKNFLDSIVSYALRTDLRILDLIDAELLMKVWMEVVN